MTLTIKPTGLQPPTSTVGVGMRGLGRGILFQRLFRDESFLVQLTGSEPPCKLGILREREMKSRVGLGGFGVCNICSEGYSVTTPNLRPNRFGTPCKLGIYRGEAVKSRVEEWGDHGVLFQRLFETAPTVELISSEPPHVTSWSSEEKK